MIIFYLFLIAFSNAEGFPSEPEWLEDGFLIRIAQDVSPDIENENEESLIVDDIQGELKEEKTVVKEMMSNIQAAMTEMKACLLRSEVKFAESISACTVALEQSIQEAVAWAYPQKEDNVFFTLFFFFFEDLPNIKRENENSLNVDKIQGGLMEQKTVCKEMMATILAAMAEMKECLLRDKENIAEIMEEAKIVRVQPLHLMRSEENIAESISACTAALEQSIQEAVDWANSQKEDNAGISDTGEDFIC